MIFGQTIIPIFLPMPTGESATIPADDVNALALVVVGLICLAVGFGIGLLLHDKIF